MNLLMQITTLFPLTLCQTYSASCSDSVYIPLQNYSVCRCSKIKCLHSLIEAAQDHRCLCRWEKLVQTCRQPVEFVVARVVAEVPELACP